MVEDVKRVYIGKRGQITLPKEIRERWDVESGDVLEAKIKEDELVIKRKVDPLEKGKELQLNLGLSEKEFKSFLRKMKTAQYLG